MNPLPTDPPSRPAPAPTSADTPVEPKPDRPPPKDDSEGPHDDAGNPIQKL